jgi:hypothetical protein
MAPCLCSAWPDICASACIASVCNCVPLQVLAYLDMFAELHQLYKHIQFNTQVLTAFPVNGSSNGTDPTAAANGSTHPVSTDSADSSRPPRWLLTTAVRQEPDSQAPGQPQEQVGGWVAASACSCIPLVRVHHHLKFFQCALCITIPASSELINKSSL